MGAFCLPHAIIARNEHSESWTAFFTFVTRTHGLLDDQRNTIISDREKGLLHALNKVFRNAKGFQCSRHRRGNIAGRYGRAAVQAFNECVYATSSVQLESLKGAAVAFLSLSAKNYILNVIDEHQFPVARVDNGGILYERYTNGISEAMNSANMGARVRGMDMFNALVSLERERSLKNQNIARTLRHGLTDFARNKYAEIERQSGATSVSALTGTVTSTISRKTFVVKLSEDFDSPGGLFGSCSCGIPHVQYFPCGHVIAFARTKGYGQHKIIPVELQSRQLRSQYPADLDFPNVCKEEAQLLGADHRIHLAPELPRKPGRPRKRRLLSAQERKARERVYLCTIYKPNSHNMSTCPQSSPTEAVHE